MSTLGDPLTDVGDGRGVLGRRPVSSCGGRGALRAHRAKRRLPGRRHPARPVRGRAVAPTSARSTSTRPWATYKLGGDLPGRGEAGEPAPIPIRAAARHRDRLDPGGHGPATHRAIFLSATFLGGQHDRGPALSTSMPTATTRPPPGAFEHRGDVATLVVPDQPGASPTTASSEFGRRCRSVPPLLLVLLARGRNAR